MTIKYKKQYKDAMIESRPNISVISINVIGNSPIKEKEDPQIKWEKNPHVF